MAWYGTQFTIESGALVIFSTLPFKILFSTRRPWRTVIAKMKKAQDGKERSSNQRKEGRKLGGDLGHLENCTILLCTFEVRHPAPGSLKSLREGTSRSTIPQDGTVGIGIWTCWRNIMRTLW